MSDSQRSSEGIFSQPLFAALALVAIAISFYGRFAGLGEWSFARDEFYTASSVVKITEQGLPKIGCEGLYMRGILYQYFLALIYNISGGSPELVMRLVNSVLGTLVLVPTFILARKVAGLKVAFISLILMSLSLVEIEMSRYVRMYAPFQLVFIWYVLFLYMGVVEERRRFIYLAYFSSLIGTFVHILSMLMAVLNFIPLLKKPCAKFFILPLVIGGITFSYINYDFREIRGASNLPPDLNLTISSGAAGTENIVLPKLFLPFLVEDSQLIFVFFGIFLLVVFWVARIWLDKDSHAWR